MRPSARSAFFRRSAMTMRVPWLLAIVRNTWYGRLAKQGDARRVTPTRRRWTSGATTASVPRRWYCSDRRSSRCRTRSSRCRSIFAKSSCCASSKASHTRTSPRSSACPIGTVMSRLSRGRERLIAILKPAIASRRRRMNCHEAARLIDPYVDDELAEAEAASVVDHIEGCAMCRQRVAERESLRRLVRSMPYHAAPARVRASIAAGPRPRLSSHALALAAGLAIAVTAAGTWRPRATHGPGDHGPRGRRSRSPHRRARRASASSRCARRSAHGQAVVSGQAGFFATGCGSVGPLVFPSLVDASM